MSIQKICKLYREQVLRLTLSQMSDKTGVNLKTLSAFENGRSNNLNHIKIYYVCSTEEQQTTLTHNLHVYLRG